MQVSWPSVTMTGTCWLGSLVVHDQLLLVTAATAPFLVVVNIVNVKYLLIDAYNI